nr:hypothetical protein [Paenibacillus sp. UNC451MF]
MQAIVQLDALFSSYKINPKSPGKRREEAQEINYSEHAITINAHLRIPERMIDPSSTLEQFRACLDRHVFFWPTLKDCQKMMDTYSRREPDEAFAVLEFDATSLLINHYSAVKLSKYDSGSSPRFPNNCSYRKSPDMFLPLRSFRTVTNGTVPTKVSEIKEVLIFDQVHNVSQYLQAVYVNKCIEIPEQWRELKKLWSDLQV